MSTVMHQTDSRATIMKDSFLNQVVMDPTLITETTSNILELFLRETKPSSTK